MIDRFISMRVCFASLSILSAMIPVQGHVLLIHPESRVQNDYLYTFDGSCNYETCNDFCGWPYDEQGVNVTTLQAGIPIAVRWFTNVAHPPFQYRISFNTMDGQFDDETHVLTTVSNEAAADPGNEGYLGTFTGKVTIPLEYVEVCGNASSPCVMQLYDLYYFVSCANVVLTDGTMV